MKPMRVLRTLCAFLVAVVLLAQEQRPIVVVVREVEVPVTVTKNGEHVNGLEVKDFTLYDNGKVQDIKLDVSFVPISVVVCIQANNTVEPVLGQIKTIGPLLTSLVAGEQGEVAIIAFDHRIRTMQDFTNEPDLLKSALEKINPGSTTSAQIDTMFQAARLLRNRPKDRRKVILLISETQDRGSEGRLREALLEIQFANIQVHTVNINRAVTTLLAKGQTPRPDHVPPAARAPLPGGAPQTPTTTAQAGGLGGNAANFVPVFVEIFKAVKGIFIPNPAEVLTRYTGGREYSFLTREQLQRAISAIGEDLHSQYTLRYNPNNQSDGGWHDVKVVVNRPGVKVVARNGYWMAGGNE
jgi:VWFA-related protein